MRCGDSSIKTNIILQRSFLDSQPRAHRPPSPRLLADFKNKRAARREQFFTHLHVLLRCLAFDSNVYYPNFGQKSLLFHGTHLFCSCPSFQHFFIVR